jgi:hypothetical protein
MVEELSLEAAKSMTIEDFSYFEMRSLVIMKDVRVVVWEGEV